ncbi:hypothetical protein [Reinekea sp.]|jgi:hypothetical protein|uniref:hypothetical protein n=1 Tax=Reinekea sp. TaxID=1970455 RepID=UPI003988A4B1
MTQPLAELFPEIQTEAWQKEREECWLLALEKGEWKSEYRKKDLERIRHYFFTGEVLDDLPITKYTGYMIDLFPIQTKAGYDYYYQTHEFTQDQVEGNIRSAFLNQESKGMRWQEQKAYFDYHVGQEYKPEITLVTAGKEVVISLDAIGDFESMIAKFSIFLRKGVGAGAEKILYFVHYFESLVNYIENNNIDASKIDSEMMLKLVERVKSGETGSKKESVIPYQKKLIEALLPIMERLERSLK